MMLRKLVGALGLDVAVDVDVLGIGNDSRHVQAGDLFCAITGDGHDGSAYINAAIAAGAVAVAVDPLLQDVPAAAAVPVIEIDNLNQRLGELAAALHGRPSESLRLIGITGTNGKTTCAHVYAQAAAAFGRCGQLGTLGYGFAPALQAATHTTPLAPRVQQLLAGMRDEQAVEVVMEVSSHALVQNRVGGCHFHTAAFTNISRDHLDYHGSMKNYAEAKAQLFNLPGLQAAVINADDAFGLRLLARLPANVERIAFTLNAAELTHLPPGIHLLTADAATTADGLQLTIGGDFGSAELRSPLVGQFNAANLLAVLGCLIAGDRALPEAVAALATATAAPGRMERVVADIDAPLPAVLVDYAHTPDALSNALQAAREHCGGKLWCVFGCGGDRDAGKRPEMGAAAEQGADFVVLTNDNPRTESPVAIADAICAGMRGEPALRELDRERAIHWAIARAAPTDTVLIAGKGHENYQEINGQRRAFVDHDIARAALTQRAAGFTHTSAVGAA